MSTTPPEPTAGLGTGRLAERLRGILGPPFHLIDVTILFRLTRDLTRSARFICPAIGIGVVFYVPNIIETTA
ncbi:hypothetical protein [Actinomadura sp. NPDC049753]|uniref:hypothetical protein n=1 Tax=Actinomadura sp. NPDC049753 TaxID=3154739 RepID=UPI00341F560A